MFRKGDRVVCLYNNSLATYNNFDLETDKIYIVSRVGVGGSIGLEQNNKIKEYMSYDSKRFVLLSEYRKMKLDKINETNI